MSQFYINTSGSGPPPGSVVSLTPDQGGVVLPDGAGNINVFGQTSTIDNDNGIRTFNGGASELDVRLTNRLTGSGTAVGAVTTDLVTFSLGASGSYRFNFLVAGRDTAGAAVGQGVGYTIDGSARTDGATATIISTPDIDADEDVALTTALISLIASGNNIIVRATGVAGETLTYKLVGTYVVV